MSYSLAFTDSAKSDLDFHKKSGNSSINKKLSILLNELCVSPTIGTGKPEKLKHNLTGLWSRRINREHRLVYEIREEIIVVHSLKGHY